MILDASWVGHIMRTEYNSVSLTITENHRVLEVACTYNREEEVCMCVTVCWFMCVCVCKYLCVEPDRHLKLTAHQ